MTTGSPLWDAIEDIIDSYKLAMTEAGINPALVADITATVTDYAVNNYGDDT